MTTHGQQQRRQHHGRLRPRPSRCSRGAPCPAADEQSYRDPDAFLRRTVTGGENPKTKHRQWPLGAGVSSQQEQSGQEPGRGGVWGAGGILLLDSGGREHRHLASQRVWRRPAKLRQGSPPAPGGFTERPPPLPGWFHQRTATQQVPMGKHRASTWQSRVGPFGHLVS